MKTLVSPHKGFTLIELLVVIAIIGILASILVPAVQIALIKAAMTHAMVNGRSMHQALYSAYMDGEAIYPRSRGDFSFNDSTEYFRWMVTNKVLAVDFSFFATRGVPGATGMDPAGFQAENNAWCVVADLDRGTRAGTPLLFTRNLGIQRLNQPLSDALTGEQPFGEHGVVVVHKGGNARVVKQAKLASLAVDDADNVVLRP